MNGLLLPVEKRIAGVIRARALERWIVALSGRLHAAGVIRARALERCLRRPRTRAARQRRSIREKCGFFERHKVYSTGG